MTEWLTEASNYWGWLLLFSAGTFVGTLLLVPRIVSRLPVDYFKRDKRTYDSWQSMPRLVRLLLLIAQQILGILLVLMGVIMLFIPGQGLLTILIGLMMTRFPGKYQLLRWLVKRQGVLRALNWIRRREDQPPLELE